VEIREDLHQELKKTAVMNELKLYRLVNGIIAATLDDQDTLKDVIRKLKV
jgi:hypothetical protein